MYNGFSSCYDLLMKNAETEKRAQFLNSLFLRFDRMPTLLLDLCCGTGEFSNYFCDKGVSVIGVDISADMLSVAREKSAGKDILYLNEDAKELDLYGTVDGAICTLDSLNHLENYTDFCTVLKKVSLFLEKDRLFIFDLNTPFKHRAVLGNNTFVIEQDNVFCVWQNEYYKEDMSVDISLDIFTKSDGKYSRCTENFTEIAFKRADIDSAIKSAGLKTVAAFDGDTFSPPSKSSERLLFVTRKV